MLHAEPTHQLQFIPEPSHARPLFKRTYGCNYLHFILIACSHLKKIAITVSIGPSLARLPREELSSTRISSGWKQLPAQQKELAWLDYDSKETPKCNKVPRMNF